MPMICIPPADWPPNKPFVTEQDLRWSKFRHLGGEEMLVRVRDYVFPHFRTLGVNGHQPKGDSKKAPQDEAKVEIKPKY